MVLPFLFPFPRVNKKTILGFPSFPWPAFFQKKTPGALRTGRFNDVECILFCCSTGQKLTGEFFIVFRGHLFGEPFQCQIDGGVNQFRSEIIFGL